ncbi:MAG: NAD-dependent epimerase/dehydratase family protein [Rhodoferax sp.]|uniref:NAD-dependent epimerase/dehydratase family protein n=1 Tax=Rhodoferax sp. TaxID=50421 RepID=UPI00271B6147|nr:NAD-dependent epimerase/dehydratase family protein [Rhodoferax sp.]MDO8449438.1 NAD-dependent epimerase/dehydratase family protein [Rhodoferax sp.]
MAYTGITLVTGAGGFVGRCLVEHLASLGVRVRATDQARADTAFLRRLGVEFIPADLTQPHTLQPLFAGPVDRVFHLGAICNFSTPLAQLYPVNVLGVEHITRLAVEAGVKRYIHVGSTSVYGPYPGTPLREDSPRNPQEDYGTSKRDGEDVVWKRIAEGLPAVITRPCTVYGPGCNDGAGKAFSRPASIAAVPGDGRQRLSNIRVEDVASAVEYLSHRDDAVGQAFNLTDDSNPTLEEALTIAAQTFGTKVPTRHLPLWLLKSLARIDGAIAAHQGRIPELEYNAIRYLHDDYLVDNTKLKASGYRLRYPDFRASMAQMKSP